MPNRNCISHNTQLTPEEKRLCEASTSEVILYYITYNHFYFGLAISVFGGICLLHYIYR